ncbi:MAG: aromatic ring-hydroxylating dioxygenase subunit alpha [Maricaulaceae bacterium]|jgi:phenylpropionate dioxygenase-like ring-hydroxylating dioxygenase large terminal subunit
MSFFLYDTWYFACLSKDLRAGRMARRELLGEPVVMGRTKAGAPFALRDICPHRAAPLSAGAICEAAAGNGAGDAAASVECPYHGWKFRVADGMCSEIPSLVADQAFEHERIRVKHYPLAEKDGLVWIYMPEGKRFEGAPETPPPDLPASLGMPKLVERARFDCHVDHAVVGLMDPAHGPYVHRQWWWRTGSSMHEKAKKFEPRPRGFAMVAHKPSSNSYAYKILGGAPTTEIVFQLPSIRTEHITNDKHQILGFTAVTPVNENATDITQVFYWDFPLFDFVRPAIRPFTRAFLKQDGDMVNLQQEGLKYDPNLMLIDDADMQAKWYHQLKKEWVAARAESRAFANPVQETTLRWRS